MTFAMGPIDMEQAILDRAVEDWCGLWEIESAVRSALGRTDDPTLRRDLRERLATMMDDGLVKAAQWSEGAPEPMTADEVRELDDDSPMWRPPGESSIEVRLTATDEGDRKYFGQAQ